MLITVLGNSIKASKLASKLAENKNDIVFYTGKAELTNEIEISPFNVADIKDFISANEINLCIAADDNLAECDWGNVLSDTECCTATFDSFITKLCMSRSASKKFAYKNKIQTTKFAVFEKLQQGLDYLQEAQYPVIITPDTPNGSQGAFISETKEKARKRAELLFQTGNKKIVIENFIQGSKYTKYIISDGFSTYDLFETISYFDEISTNNVYCISKEAKEKIDKEITPALINSLLEEGVEFQGILAITCIIDKQQTYFSSLGSFPDGYDFEIMLNTLEEDLGELLYACAQGNLAEKFDRIKFNSKIALSTEIDNEIVTTCANTFKRAEELLVFEGGDEKLIKEAINYWTR